nr:Crp/Fnr family transcriptional regulator [uncultured Tyzzerella sp.]
MEKYIKIIKNSKLFFNISEDEIKLILNHLLLHIKDYKKGQYIFNIGDKINGLGLVVSGLVHIEKEDFFGNRSIICQVCENDIFGASYYYDEEPLPNNILAATNTTIMFLDIKKSLNLQNHCCDKNLKVMDNFIKIMLKKNKDINKKLDHISQRNIRNKILSFLYDQSLKNNSNSFYISFNRQQLADYLCIDRSALSSELSKMRKENLINFTKNYFQLNDNIKSLK